MAMVPQLRLAYSCTAALSLALLHAARGHDAAPAAAHAHAPQALAHLPRPQQAVSEPNGQLLATANVLRGKHAHARP